MALAIFNSTKADVLVSDSFNYLDGDLAAVSSGLWTVISGSGNLNVSSGHAVVSSSLTADDATAFTPVGAGVLYYGLTATVTSVPGTTGSYLAALWDGETGAATDYFGRLQVAQGSTSSKVKFGIINDGSPNTPVYFGSEFDLNSAVQIVVKFDFSTMTSTLWVNPANESSASVTDSVAAIFSADSTTPGGVATLGNFLLRQANSIGTTSVDNLVVSTTFVEAVPEPGTVAMVGLGLGVVLYGVRRRRALA